MGQPQAISRHAATCTKGDNWRGSTPCNCWVEHSAPTPQFQPARQMGGGITNFLSPESESR